MSNLTDFFPSGGGGGLTPKFEEFNSSGTFTPTQALIDAGGYIEVFLVAGGASSNSTVYGGTGGEVLIKKMYLTSITNVSVTIGAGSVSFSSANGGNSIFAASTAGGVDLTATGGRTDGRSVNVLGSGFSAHNSEDYSAGSGTMGYGAGGSNYRYGGVDIGKANSGQGSQRESNAGSGYCLIKWYE